MKTNSGILFVFMIAAITLIWGAAANELWAGEGRYHYPWFEEFEEADIYFELNNTDGDLGIHGKVDGGPWKRIWLKDSTHRQLMNVTARGRLKKQGVTELFFESAEPRFTELPPKAFFNRFPEGVYKIYGISEDGKLLVGKSLIRHVMPAPPDGISINGTDVNLQEVNCEAEENVPVVEPDDDGNIVISWEEVTESHPEIGEEGDIEVALYQLVVEFEVPGEEFESVYSVFLPPDVTSMTVPGELIGLGLDDDGEGEFKYEILVKDEEGGNQTATESCFLVE
jgi:hypothetical protein